MEEDVHRSLSGAGSCKKSSKSFEVGVALPNGSAKEECRSAPGLGETRLGLRGVRPRCQHVQCCLLWLKKLSKRRQSRNK